MIFAKKKILVWCDDPPEDPVISIFAGCLANHDRAHSRLLGEEVFVAKIIHTCKDTPFHTTPTSVQVLPNETGLS